MHGPTASDADKLWQKILHRQEKDYKIYIYLLFFYLRTFIIEVACLKSYRRFGPSSLDSSVFSQNAKMSHTSVGMMQAAEKFFQIIWPKNFIGVRDFRYDFQLAFSVRVCLMSPNVLRIGLSRPQRACRWNLPKIGYLSWFHKIFFPVHFLRNETYFLSQSIPSNRIKKAFGEPGNCRASYNFRIVQNPPLP